MEKMNEPYYKEIQDFYASDLKTPTLKEVNIWPQAGRSSSSSSGVSFSCPHVCLCLFLLCLPGSVLGHPQCLDYVPPFQPPFHLEFCSAYKKFGCSDQERDNSIAAKFWDIMDYIDPRGHKLCGTYIKDILCQEDEKKNKWKKQGICIGSTTACAFPGMISSYSKFIISFAEDEAGDLCFMSTSHPSAYVPHGSLYKLIDPARRAPPGKCKYKPVPVKTKSKLIPFVPRAKTVLELLHEPSTAKPPKKSSTHPAAIPTVSSKKAKKIPSTKIKASTVQPAPSGKDRQRAKAKAKPHKPKQGEKVAHNSRTTPAPPLPKRKSFRLARSKKFLPKNAALAKGKLEKRKKKQLLKLSDILE